MAKILNITELYDSPRLKIYFHLENERAAEWYAASYLMSVRMNWMALDLYHKGSILILDGPVNFPGDEQCIRITAQQLKDGIENDNRNFSAY